jgi:hypothetical protein
LRAVKALWLAALLGVGCAGDPPGRRAPTTVSGSGDETEPCTIHVQGDGASGLGDDTYTTSAFASDSAVGCLYTQHGDAGELFQLSFQVSVDGALETSVPLTITEATVSAKAWLSLSYHELLAPKRFWSCGGPTPAEARGTFTFTVSSAATVPGDTNPRARRVVAHGTLHAVCPPLAGSATQGLITVDATF